MPELRLQPGHIIRQDPDLLEIYNPGSGPPRKFRVPVAVSVSSLDQLVPEPAAVTTDAAGDLSAIP